MTAEEVATYLGIKRNTVYLWAQEQRIPHIRLGQLVRFRREDIEAFVQASFLGNQLSPR